MWKQMVVFPVSLCRARPDPHEKVKVINYKLIEEHSQTFNEGLFLPCCKLYNKMHLKKKIVNFPFNSSPQH